MQWVKNPHAVKAGECSPDVWKPFPAGCFERARAFHAQIPEYKPTRLACLKNLAEKLGLAGIYVKDESCRLGLPAFKVLGGSFAVYQFILTKLGLAESEPLTFADLTSDRVKNAIADITFTTATDGNHGRGVAWAASLVGCKSVVYVHKDTVQARIAGIESAGARVVVVDANYDDTMRKCAQDAATNGWQVISDTAWEGYEDIPAWVMQGYSTMVGEAVDQLAGMGVRPTHVFTQGGVGAYSAAVFAYLRLAVGKAGAPPPPTAAVFEPEHAACLYESAKAGDGQPHIVTGDLDTIMAGLACGEPNPLAWPILNQCVDVFLSCPDYMAATGMRVLAAPTGSDPAVVSGESGSASLGALMHIMRCDSYKPLREALGLGPSSHVLLFNTEGATDPENYERIVWGGAHPTPPGLF